jgi:hypothetical protein
MRSKIPLILSFFVLGSHVGCSIPERIVFQNNASQAISIVSLNGDKTIVASGESFEFKFDYDFRQATIIAGDLKCWFRWRYPSSELIDKSKTPHRIAMSYEEDGRIYALKMLSSGAGTNPIQPQPEGFPLDPVLRN